MPPGFFGTAFTPSVRAEQAKHGSEGVYARLAAAQAKEEAVLSDNEISFIGERDSFYLATVSETGWPYVQHRGGPVGFLRVLDGHTLAWAEFSGNRQYVSIGNVSVSDKASLILVDYPSRRRLKVLGHMTVLEGKESTNLASRLVEPSYPARVEHTVQIKVQGFDWNCPQHITPRFTLKDVKRLVDPLHREIAELKAELAGSSLKAS